MGRPKKLDHDKLVAMAWHGAADDAIAMAAGSTANVVKATLHQMGARKVIEIIQRLALPSAPQAQVVKTDGNGVSIDLEARLSGLDAWLQQLTLDVQTSKIPATQKTELSLKVIREVRGLAETVTKAQEAIWNAQAWALFIEGLERVMSKMSPDAKTEFVTLLGQEGLINMTVVPPKKALAG